jgi:cytidylate kinase
MAIITISRGTFSGGTALADCLGKRLGYQVVGREVVLEAAREFGISPVKLTTAMEKPPSFWQQLTGERTTYLNYVRATLTEHAIKGDLVYHGHAGHLLLAGVAHVICARVIADMEYRIKAAMQQLQVDREEAAAYIKRVDEERVNWTWFLYGIDWDEPSLYDITLNLERLSIESACEIVAHMTELEEFQPSVESRNSLQDLALGSRVWATLMRDPRTSTVDARVSSSGGVVTITGNATRRDILDAVPLVAGAVPGVKEIRPQMDLVPVRDPINKPRRPRPQ